jgi:hypothetical protein
MKNQAYGAQRHTPVEMVMRYGSIAGSIAQTCPSWGLALGLIIWMAATPPLGWGQASPARPVAPYLQGLDQEDIFDPGKGEILSPLQQAAQRLAKGREALAQRSVSKIKNIISYEYDLTGPTEDKVLEQAMVRALKSAAGRLYFENYFLLGLDLLEPYLLRTGSQFIARTVILDQRILAEDRVAMKLRLSVNLDTLYQDLNEKKFIAQPNLRPVISVHLQEIFNGTTTPTMGGRERIENILERNLFQISSMKMAPASLGVDLSTDPVGLKTARLAAQRNNIDIIVTGALAVRSIRDEKILFDDYSFKESEITLKVYRVDTGDLIDQFSDRYSASGADDTDATRNSLDTMVPRVSRLVAGYLSRMWPKTMLDQSGYRLMISGVNRDTIASAYSLLRTLSPSLEIYEKSYFGDVLVFNIVYPEAKLGELEEFLRSADEPQFNIRKIDRRHFELEVL